MIEITLYKTTSKNNEITKDLENGINLQGTLKEATSILNPVITIKTNNNILSCNYCYIPLFSRYYYITDIIVDHAYMTLNLRVDVLMSFKADILASTQIISRQENAFNLDIIDEKMPFYDNFTTVIRKVENTPFITETVDFLNNENYFFLVNISNLGTTLQHTANTTETGGEENVSLQ